MTSDSNYTNDLFNDDYTDRLYANYTINYVLPFSNHDNGPLMAIAGFYALLFMIGTCGNAAILAVVYHVRSARHNTTLTYICILCIVDFLSMLPLPMTIIDQVLGFWMFGTFACKLFRLLEHIGKIFSTFILVAFSIDRYCAVCHPLKIRVRSQKTVYMLLSSMFGVTCLMLFPILLYAHSKELIVHEKFDMSSQTITRLHLFKCVDDLGDNLFIGFTLYCFMFAYMVPLLLMIYFYYGMLIRLFKQSRAVRQSLGNGRRKGMDERIPVVHIAVYTLAICLFHFICWTPYWVSVLYSLYLEIAYKDMPVVPSFAFIYFMYGVHALPYINSASNFILYGLLNRQLHQNNADRKISRNGRSPPHAHGPPALRLTECSDIHNVSGFQADSLIRTPPSEVSASRINEQSPLVSKGQTIVNRQYSNGTTAASQTPTQLSEDEESVII